MNGEHKNTVPPLRDSAPTSERKPYNAPSLHDLDGLEKTEGGTNLFIFEATGGAATS